MNNLGVLKPHHIKGFLLFYLTFIAINIHAQKQETINWINSHAIKIEDANPDTKLKNFDKNIPIKFEQAKLFGFGESSHHIKEYFDLKAKFFKYLVEDQDVRIFIMEDSYPSEAGINKWIEGGEGDITTIANNFSIAPWYCKEIVNLLKWMRDYNKTQPKDKHIGYYGMDIQNVQGINIEIRQLVKKYGIPIKEELLLAVDECTNKKIDYYKKTDWADKQIPKLEDIEQLIRRFQIENDKGNNPDFISGIRALKYLTHYTYYLQNSQSVVRDEKMFENVKWILSNDSDNGKGFIWAHNEHINNIEMLSYGSGWINLGARLKEHYKEDYYSVGFDFGTGKLTGLVTQKDGSSYWDIFELTEPHRNTYAKTLIEANADIYFMDLKEDAQSLNTNFFGKKTKQLYLGGPGYNPKDLSFLPKKFSEMYDGLIFVKTVTVPNYKLKNE